MSETFARIDNVGAPTFPCTWHPLNSSAADGYRLHRAPWAAMKRWPLPSVEEVCRGARRIAVMENIVDHTNVGALMRSAAALNVDAVLVTPSCGDPLYRRAARVSMGTVFQIPWTRIGGDDKHYWPFTGMQELRDLGFTTVAMALEDDSISLEELVRRFEQRQRRKGPYSTNWR